MFDAAALLCVTFPLKTEDVDASIVRLALLHWFRPANESSLLTGFLTAIRVWICCLLGLADGLL